MAGDLALEVVPLIGDPVTILLDYTMMKRVDRTARMVFRERWLRDAGRIEGEIAAAPSTPRRRDEEPPRPLRAGDLPHVLRTGLRRHITGCRRRAGLALAAWGGDEGRP